MWGKYSKLWLFVGKGCQQTPPLIKDKGRFEWNGEEAGLA